MIIYFDPNNLNSQYNQFLPLLESSFTCLPCDGLEAQTGADICLATTPIPPTDLDFAISQLYLFVQLKFGNDIFSFDQTRSELARVQKARIPLQQAYLLFIGRCYPDANGIAFVDGKQAFSQDKPRQYALFEELQDLAEYRGMKFRQIVKVEDLPTWIETKFKTIEKIQREGKREFYPARVQKIEDDANIWQRVLAVDESDWRYTLVNGLDGFGSTLANNVNDYLHQYGLLPCLFEALRVLTELDEKGKPVHDIKGWGKKSIEDLRHKLGLLSSFDLPKNDRSSIPFVQNLAAPMTTNPGDELGEWQRGVKAAIGAFEVAMKAGVKDGREMLRIVQRAASCFDAWDEATFREWRETLYCDDWLKVKYPTVYELFTKERTTK